MCLLSKLLSTVIVTSCSFTSKVQCVCPNCSWATHAYNV